MSKRANRLLFSTLVTIVVVWVAALLWAMRIDPAYDEISLIILAFLVLSSGVALVHWLGRRSSSRDPNDPDGHLRKWYGNGP